MQADESGVWTKGAGTAPLPPSQSPHGPPDMETKWAMVTQTTKTPQPFTPSSPCTCTLCANLLCPFCCKGASFSLVCVLASFSYCDPITIGRHQLLYLLGTVLWAACRRSSVVALPETLNRLTFSSFGPSTPPVPPLLSFERAESLSLHPSIFSIRNGGVASPFALSGFLVARELESPPHETCLAPFCKSSASFRPRLGFRKVRESSCGARGSLGATRWFAWPIVSLVNLDSFRMRAPRSHSAGAAACPAVPTQHQRKLPIGGPTMYLCCFFAPCVDTAS